MLRVGGVVAVAIFAAAFGVAPALGAAPAPAWKITATALPTIFAAGSEGTTGAGPMYFLAATNIGGGVASGPITVEATLPAALTALEPEGAGGDPGTAVPSCSVVAQTVTCTAAGSLHPGRWLGATFPVDVAPGAKGPLDMEAIVSGGAAEARTTVATQVGAVPPPFGFLSGASGLSASLTYADGSSATAAGSHSYQATFDFGFSSEVTGSFLGGSGHVRDLHSELPWGLVVNPGATPALCTEAQLEAKGTNTCPDGSQIGIATVRTIAAGVTAIASPLYNMVPPPGSAAEFGLNVGGLGVYVHLMGRVDSAGEYELGTDIAEIVAREQNPFFGVQVQLWGDPSDSSHDSMRGSCVFDESSPCSRQVDRLDRPFLTMPSSCRGTLSTNALAADWEETARKVSASALLEDSLGAATGSDGCNRLAFDPAIEAKSTTNLSDSPTGFEFRLRVPQTDEFERPATANFKDIAVILPEGMAVNPSSASGQGVCRPAEIGLTTPVGEVPAHFGDDPASCPDAAKIGSVEVDTPLLNHALNGVVYLAEPFDNPFGSLLAIYLDVEDPRAGIVAKLTGRVEADPESGRLTVSFAEDPELPIEEVRLSFAKGPRASLVTPLVCGVHRVATDIVPWSAPEGVDATPSDSFAIAAAPAGAGPCSASEAAASYKPGFSAGTVAPRAGAFSPFVLTLTRDDGSQRIAAIDTTLPPGLAAKLVGVHRCPEAQIASCPSASQVGTVDIASGAGGSPFHAQGHAYLAGPYKGAPLSLAIVVPAVSGSIDLGAVAIRAALYVDPATAQLSIRSDPIPRILRGIPLDLRAIAIQLGRRNFTLNPTNCAPTAIGGETRSVAGRSATLAARFQVGGCARLPFKPRLALRFGGAMGRNGHPAVTAVLRPRAGDANLRRLALLLPRGEYLDQSHIKGVCSRARFATGHCPADSAYGRVAAWSPLLDAPLRGRLYLRESGRRLPDLAADLDGEVHLTLAGHLDTPQVRLRASFGRLPDLPFSRLRVSLDGGPRGLLVNSESICRREVRGGAGFVGQNGKARQIWPRVEASCGAQPRIGRAGAW